jgi:hypothetical protein
MKHSSTIIDPRPSLPLLDEPPHELTRALLESRFSLVLQVRHSWRLRRRDRPCDFMAVDADLRTWWIAAVDPSERLRALLTLMSNRKLAGQAVKGARVMLHCWTRRTGVALQVECIELAPEDFTVGR